MPHKISLRLATAATLAGAVLALLPAAALARDGTAYPAVQVSPDLAAEWVLQLSPGSGVVPGYSRPNLGRPARAPVQAYEGVRRVEPVPVMRRPQPIGAARLSSDPGYTGAIAAPARGAPRQMERVDAIDPVFLPQQVDYPTRQAAGTVVIDTQSKFLYLVEGDGKARRYGVGVGKPGFAWAGTHKVTQKKEWPTWTPPSQMRDRERKKGRILPARMDGGPANPLGARAMYLGSTLYRIHGTNQPWTIGKAVSSGCIRMRNEDVSDLYERIPVGTRVIVL